MKHYLLYLLSFCLLLTSCNAERRATRKAKKAVSTTYDLPRLAKGDTAHVKVTTPPKSAVGKVVDKVFPPQVPTVGPDGSTIILPKNNKKGSISIAFGGSASSGITGKKAAAAVGEGATTTSIGKAKGPTATGDNATATDYTKQGQRGGAAASGDGATATNEPKGGLPGWLIVGGIALAAFGVWRFLANTTWGKLQPWLPSASKAKWIALLFGAGVVAYIVLT